MDLLGLDADQVLTAADFHEAYGRLVEPAGENGDDFKALIEAASAYRLAGQWRLMAEPAPGVVPNAGVDLLLHAASLFFRAGLTYGAYLGASLAPDEYRHRLGSWTELLLRSAGQRRGENDHRLLDHAQQQTYLLLACAVLAAPGSKQAAALKGFADRSPHRFGVLPLGSLAMPVRMFWSLAVDLLSPEDAEAPGRYAGTLTELSRAYARTVDLARANARTWSNAAAPVDVADLDVIGAVAMGARHFGPDWMQELLDITDLPAVALVPLDLGRRVAAPVPPGPGPAVSVFSGLDELRGPGDRRGPDDPPEVDDAPEPDDLPGQDRLPGVDDPPEPDGPGRGKRPDGGWDGWL
ncbi:hypothetical protein [Streptomyces sp. NPDC001500]